MELRRKLKILAEAARYDASCAGGGARESSAGALGVYKSTTPDGRTVALLKVLLSNECIFRCHFCVNRADNDVPRATFTPSEVAAITVELHRRNLIEGLFLSSGVAQSPDHTMEQMGEVARLLREEHRFGGYIHIKAVPGASPELLDRAGAHADRMSANIELPTERDLAALAPDKHTATIEEAMAQIRARRDEAFAERRPQSFLPAGQTTQMIVGATTATTDAEILATASRLYERHRLRRVYYSAYTPIPDAAGLLPAEGPPRAREQRLYEADWLLRSYGFEVGELTTAAEPNLDPGVDPKLAWALRNRHLFPVDVNRAPREQLLRVPGLGARSVERIVEARRQRSLALLDLARLGAVLLRARFFVLTLDHNPDALLIDRHDLRDRLGTPPGQLPLFGPGVGARPVVVADLDDFRTQARRLAALGVRPELLRFDDASPQGSLPLDELSADDEDETPPPPPADGEAGASPPVRVPRAFVELCEAVACHRDPRRWDLLYRALYRLTHGEHELLAQPHDPSVARLRELEREVWRDVQRALERVRFRPGADGETYEAYHAPKHRTLRLIAWAFDGRRRGQRWTLRTPDGCAHSDGHELRYTPGEPAPPGLLPDELAALFSPADLAGDAA